MEIVCNNESCIITPLSVKLLKGDIERLKQEIFYFKNKKIGLNLSFVKECTIEFFELLNTISDLSLFNINSDLFTILLTMDFDKNNKLYLSETDFITDSHQLINRKFQIVQQDNKC